ncbi:hypothetical protein BDW02DRAFT_561926 [Decorospora gaudefroyi]|uniref:C2H2-type domain-containing protein n=1 Tax=Decorospora gaudefroyi TaxID=184978 RepID=A0A6A5JZ76_9PLEO|nr:hypothetical protein BDW02DRAFT_561926 [Decorospora gaudefroyi]
MDLSTTAPADIVIATVVDELARDFINLADALTTESRFATQVPSTTIYDEFTRFKLWAGNIAAHRKGRRSLEYRLRDATLLKSEVHSLLNALSAALRNALSIANGERVPWDEMSASDTDSDSDQSDGSNSNAGLLGSTELSQLAASTKALITSLFRLSIAIRNPAPNSQSMSTITIDKSFFEQHDIQHVQEKFPKAPHFLVERLGRALSARRQYLTYREEHHQKMTKNIERIGHEKATTEFTTNSTEATPLPRIERATSMNLLDEGDDVASQTSYATSVNATIRVPPLPREARNKDFFECPLCFLLVSIPTPAGWKQHVYRDLHPYCCTYEHCTIADHLYDSRKAWFAHELEAHRTAWQCIEECSKVYEAESDFEKHVRKSHPDLASENTLSVLKRTSAKGADLGGQTECALCGKNLTLRALQRHLGSHQQHLALFALPPNLDNTEDDPNDDDEIDVRSMGAGAHNDEELSDMSDTSDTEEPDEAAEFYRPMSHTSNTEEVNKVGATIDLSNNQNSTPRNRRPDLGTFKCCRQCSKKWSMSEPVEPICPWCGSKEEKATRTMTWSSGYPLERAEYSDMDDESSPGFGEGKSPAIESEEMQTLPTYPKLHKDDIDEETLHYYEISYEYDADPDWFIMLQEMSQKELEILFEHTRRLRARQGKSPAIESEETQLDMHMRKRLADFGFVESQIEALVRDEKEKESLKTNQKGLERGTATSTLGSQIMGPPPTYAKIHKDHLDVETLHYYDIPYEYDTDPDYFIVLREMSEKETEVLFEHTRRLRAPRRKKDFSEAQKETPGSSKEYALQRRNSQRRIRSEAGSPIAS